MALADCAAHASAEEMDRHILSHTIVGVMVIHRERDWAGIPAGITAHYSFIMRTY